MNKFKKTISILALSSVAFSNVSYAGSDDIAGALIGAVAGAAIGNAIGKDTKATVIGAAIGTGVGLTASHNSKHSYGRHSKNYDTVTYTSYEYHEPSRHYGRKHDRHHKRHHKHNRHSYRDYNYVYPVASYTGVSTTDYIIPNERNVQYVNVNTNNGFNENINMAPEPYCREFTNQVNIGGKLQDGYGKACRQPDGDWKIVE